MEVAGYVGGVRTELDYGGRIFCFTDAKRRAKRGSWEILVRKEFFFWRGEGVCVEGGSFERKRTRGVSRENKIKGREKRCTWR